MTLASQEGVDVLVVGGGINGAGIARDAAGRGLRVLLVEQHDLAAHTSSASSKLIHGGLRYLEHGEFSLVKKALAEREVLLAIAPHLVRLQAFVLPHAPGMRAAWQLRAGLWLYDHLARRVRVPGSSALDLARAEEGAALQPQYARGFRYWDAWADDARLVIANAQDCVRHGGEVRTRTVCEAATREGDVWRVRLRGAGGNRSTVTARALVNAAGPWAAQFARQQLAQAHTQTLKLVRGSHIVVPAMFAHAAAYILQQPDGRIVFALPFEGRYTLVGTTEVVHAGDPGAATPDAEEIVYLCAAVNRAFRATIAPEHVVWQFAGVRPLLDEPGESATRTTRDYRIELDAAAAPLLNVWGGKLTTYRVLAEEALDRLGPALGVTRGAWTARERLPGGDVGDDFEAWAASRAASLAWLPAALLARWLRAYGSEVDTLLGGAQDMAALGAEIAPGLFEAELRHLARHEWARTADDVLWRRSKLGLALIGMPPEERAAVCARIDAVLAASVAADT